MKLEIEIPEPTKEDLRKEWTYNFDFLTKVKDLCLDDDYFFDQEEILKILDVLFKIARQ